MKIPETSNGWYDIDTTTGIVTQYAKTYFTWYQKIFIKCGINQRPKGGKITKGKFKWNGMEATFIPKP